MSQKEVHLSVPEEHSSKQSFCAVPTRNTPNKKTLLRDGYELEDFYAAVRAGRLDSVHVPHSDVFFVKYALEHKTGKKFTLESIERAMKAEGWSESRVLKPKRYKFV